jgi:hypothetical protein
MIPMSRTSIIQHDGQPVVLLDFAGFSNPADTLHHIEEARDLIARLPRDGTALTLTDVRGSRYNVEVLQALKELAAHNKPFVAKAAVATSSGLHRVAIMAVATFSGRALRAFSTREAALDWLVHGVEHKGEAAA